MGNQHKRDAIRAYMAEHGVNYTTARRALAQPPQSGVLGWVGDGKGWLDEAWTFHSGGLDGALPVLRNRAKANGWTMGPAATIVAVWLIEKGMVCSGPGPLSEHADALAGVVALALCPMGEVGALNLRITSGAPHEGGAMRARVTFERAKEVVADALRDAAGRLPQDAGAEETMDAALNAALAALDISPWEGGTVAQWQTPTPVRFAAAAAGDVLLPNLLHAPKTGPAREEWVRGFTQGHPVIGAGLEGEVRVDLMAGPVLVVGSAGSGKTALLEALAEGALAAPGVSLALLTGATSGYSSIDSHGLAYHHAGSHGEDGSSADLDSLAGVLERIEKEIHDRLVLLTGGRYATLGGLREAAQSGAVAVAPHEVPDRLIVLVDQPTGGAEVWDRLTGVAARGRCVEVHLVLSTQRVTSGDVPLGLRSTFVTRISMGRLDTHASHALFGAPGVTRPGQPRGWGAITTGGSVSPVQVMLPSRN